MRPVPQICPSLLSADFTCLRKSVAELEQAGVEILHLDIMDGHFVPNLTFGPMVAKAIRSMTKARLEAHLMVEKPETLAERFWQIGVETILCHAELSSTADLLLRLKNQGVRVGVVLNPETPVSSIEPFLTWVDQVLVMSVHPGFGGQAFLPDTLEKCHYLRPFADRYGFVIEMDGGLDENTIPQALKAGVDYFVAGTGVFGKKLPPGAQFARLKALLHRN